ncbi:MAG: hypothetical protein LBJ02_05295 [Bifidobacteriaceae bacterium]|jgi:hypothetical protein|nr:hypothetical protein [Bifidobacteriaceae bacterium]
MPRRGSGSGAGIGFSVASLPFTVVGFVCWLTGQTKFKEYDSWGDYGSELDEGLTLVHTMGWVAMGLGVIAAIFAGVGHKKQSSAGALVFAVICGILAILVFIGGSDLLRTEIVERSTPWGF